MTSRSIVPFCLFILSLSGCASMTADIPNARMDLPETNGKKHPLAGKVGYASSQTLTFTTDASDRPPDLSKPTLENSDDLRSVMVGELGYAVLDRLQFDLKATFGPSPYVLSAKYQILGDNYESSKEGNVSLAVTAGYGYGNSTHDGDQKGIFGPGGFDWHSSETTKMSDFAVIFGYRTSQRLLVYAGGFANDITIDGKIDDSKSDDATSPAATYDITYSGRQRGGNLGLSFDFMDERQSFINLEAVYSDLQLGSLHNCFWGGNLVLGLRL